MITPLRRFRACFLAAASLGVGASLGYPLGIALMCLMPVLSVVQPNRRRAYVIATSYYLGAAWPVIPAARNFFGPTPTATNTMALWVAASLALAAPWLAVWTAKRGQLLWRIPLGLAGTAVPPLGIIGWASPLCSAGLLFPGTGWAGLIATALLPAAALLVPRRVIPAAVGLVLVSNCLWNSPPTPIGWEAVNTNFGAIAHGPRSPSVDFDAMLWLQGRAITSPYKVIVFPETVVPLWSDATDVFWKQTLDTLKASGKTVVIGAGMPTNARPVHFDFAGELAALHEQRAVAIDSFATGSPSYRNGVLVRGSEASVFLQRIPVPLGMWRPFQAEGVPLNAAGPGTVAIAAERVAIWICYEQLLIWPVVESMLERPTVIVAIANDYWVTGTPIERSQSMMVMAWARLFGLPRLFAVNH